MYCNRFSICINIIFDNMNYSSSDSNSNKSDTFILHAVSLHSHASADHHDEDYTLMLESSVEKDDTCVFYPPQSFELVETLINELDKRNRMDSISSQEMVSRYSYIDTSFDDLAMAVEANSPDIIDGKPFGFETVFPPSPCKFRLRWTEEMVISPLS